MTIILLVFVFKHFAFRSNPSDKIHTTNGNEFSWKYSSHFGIRVVTTSIFFIILSVSILTPNASAISPIGILQNDLKIKVLRSIGFISRNLNEFRQSLYCFRHSLNILLMALKFNFSDFGSKLARKQKLW